MTLHNFLEMGGYAAYVWPAYGITVFVFILNMVLSLSEKKRVKKQIRAYLTRTSR